MKVCTVCARAQASIFMVLWPFSPKKNCEIVEEIWTMIERVVKSKGLRRQPRSGWPFFTNCVRNIIEKAASICVIIPKKQKGKIISTSHYRSEFRVQRYGYKLENLDLKKAVHASCKHVSEGFVNFIPKEDRPANSRHVNPLETIWIIVDETTYKDQAPKTLDELRQWLRFAWKNVTLDTLFHRLENVRKYTRRHSGF